MLDTRQLHPTLAREITGLRLWEKLDEATVAELRTLYAQHGVLVFRRQALSEAELASFCALFGELERTVRSDWASLATPEVTIISNLRDGVRQSDRRARRRRAAMALRPVLYAGAGNRGGALRARTAAVGR